MNETAKRSEQGLDDRSRNLRQLIVRGLVGGNRGHVGSSMSLVEILRVLFDDILRYRPQEPAWIDRDRCILSKGHGCLALYAILADKGYFSPEHLDRFCQVDGMLGGHPERGKVPGVEASTGALGHGLSIGVGMALAARIQKRDSRVFVIMGDGEINEGSVWEAALCAGKHKLTNLIAMVDYNKIQSAGFTKDIQDLEPLLDKWRSFGFAAVDVDGHDVGALTALCKSLPLTNDRPTAVICHTVKGKGIPFAENQPKWHHHSRFKPKELDDMYAALWRPAMRQTCVDMVHELAKTDPRVVFIGSDLSPGLLDDMKQEMPSRHYMEGVMEQHLVGMAAGMAMDGLMPYFNTIATFITRRCYEQVALDLCLHDLPVRLIANGGGLVYAPLGPTHLAVEDFAILRALPNMTVTAVADAEEMKRLMRATLSWPHPIYIRLGKGGDPVVSKEANGFAIGKGIVMRPSTARGNILLISCGVMTARALAAADILAGRGHAVEVIHIHTIKPLDEDLVLARARNAAGVFIIEEHSLIGGLGSAVVDLLVERGLTRAVIKKLGLADAFAKNYGSQDDLLEINGLLPKQIVATVETTLASATAAA